MYRDLASAAKVHLLQSMAAHIMVDSIFGVYFVGLPEEQARQLVAMERYLSSLSKSFPYQSLGEGGQAQFPIRFRRGCQPMARNHFEHDQEGRGP